MPPEPRDASEVAFLGAALEIGREAEFVKE